MNGAPDTTRTYVKYRLVLCFPSLEREGVKHTLVSIDTDRELSEWDVSRAVCSRPCRPEMYMFLGMREGGKPSLLFGSADTTNIPQDVYNEAVRSYD